MRWPDIGLAVVFVLATAIGAVGLAVYAPRQFTPAAVAPAATILVTMLGYWALAAVIVAMSMGRPIPEGDGVFMSDGGVVAMGLAILPLGIAPILLAVAVEGLARGFRGLGAALLFGFLAVLFAAGGWALAAAREEVRVGVVNGVATIIVIDGRGFPQVDVYNAADARLEIVAVTATRNPSWKVVLVDASGRQRVLGRSWSEAEAQEQVRRLKR